MPKYRLTAFRLVHVLQDLITDVVVEARDAREAENIGENDLHRSGLLSWLGYDEVYEGGAAWTVAEVDPATLVTSHEWDSTGKQ